LESSSRRITAHALAACEKFQIALGRAKEPPPLELGEAFEDAANEYLSIFEEISELHRRNRARTMSRR
jgi:hypothetical protein